MAEVGSNPDADRGLAGIPWRGQRAFLALIVTQAVHSIEEYVFRLYDVFAPARLVSSLVSDNLPFGFAVANTLIVLFGVWSYVARVRPNHRSARSFAWFWTGLEFANGVGHSVIALSRGRYFPGVATAPILIAVSMYLASRLTVSRLAQP
jgi:hypothetical protein